MVGGTRCLPAPTSTAALMRPLFTYLFFFRLLPPCPFAPPLVPPLCAAALAIIAARTSACDGGGGGGGCTNRACARAYQLDHGPLLIGHD